MDNVIKKIFAILILFMLLINNSVLMIVSTAIDDIAKLIDESKINPIIDSELQKYVNYKISDDQKGVLVQYKLKTGIEYRDDQQYFPIKSTKTEVELPKIDNLFPESVEVLTNSTKATNGESNGKDSTYNYNKENGIVEIFVENKKDDKGNIYTQDEKDARDEFVVIMNYAKETYNDKEAKRKLSFKVSMEEKLASDNNIVVRGSKGEDIGVSENKSDLISTDIITSDIYNGFINNNIKNGTKYETEYAENYNINFSYKQISDSVEINLVDDFLDEKDKIIDTKDIVYKSIKLNKENVLRIFGVEGSFKIDNIEGQTLAEINKYTEANEDGTIEINFEKELNEIFIKTTKPINNGTINIETKKAIKETMLNEKYSRILAISDLKYLNNIQEKDEKTQEVINEHEDEIYKSTDFEKVEIKQSETRVDVSLDKSEWTNNIQNDVNFTAVLVSNEPKYDLFSNPVIEIKLPQEVQKVVLGNVSTLYDNNLKVKNAEVVDKNNSKVIKVTLDGTQKEYINNAITNGVSVIIPATVILNTQVDNSDKNIEVTYSNQNAKTIDYVNAGANSKNINVKLVNKINDNKEEQKEETDNKQDENKQNENKPNEDKKDDAKKENNTIDVNKVKEALSVEVEAKVGDKILSDGDKVNEKEVIKYQIKLKNNKDYDINGLSLKGIVPEATNYATVDRGSYYAEEYKYVEEPEKRVVEIDNINLKANEVTTLFYEVVVQLIDDASEKKIESNILTYFNKEEVNSWKLNNSIKKAKISVELKSYIGRDTQDSFYYYINVTNLTNDKLENIRIETNELQKEILVNLSAIETSLKDFSFENRKISYTISSLDAGQNYEVLVPTVAGNFDNKIDECQLNMIVNATLDGDDIYRSAENIRTAYPSFVTATISSDKIGEDLHIDDEITYSIKVKNESKIKTFVKIQDCLPDELDGIEAEYEMFKLNNLQDYEIKYNLEAEKNVGYTREKKLVDLSYRVDDKTILNVDVLIPSGQTIEIKIKAKAGYVSTNTDISNFAVISGQYITTTSTNILKNNIIISSTEKEEDSPDSPEKPDSPENPNNPDSPENPSDPENSDSSDNNDEKAIYSIDGYAWIDSNKNGIKENNENSIKGLVVKLFNSSTNSIELNSNGERQIINTNDKGYYKFDYVKKGKYIVLFEYDTNQYDLTQYKKENISEELNSDVVDKEVSIDGIIKKVAVTNDIDVSGNITNINIGVVEKSKFDLKLTKYISKVTVTNEEGTKEYSYNNQQLAKVEIPRKQIKNTKINIEYKFSILNEGNIEAFVNEITDLKPDELEFTQDNNKEWILSDGNKLKNTSISGIKIKPGENKQLTLNLYKELDENSLGIINNNANITSSVNLENLKEIDVDNNNSSAELIISVKTGLSKNIIIISIFMILFITVIVYCIINKKFINVSIGIFVMLMCITTISDAQIMWGDGDNSPYKSTLRIRGNKVNGIWYYPGSDGRGYTCMDAGMPLCSTDNVHYYYKYMDNYLYSTEETIYTQPRLRLSKVDNRIQLMNEGGNTIVGPYEVKIEDADVGQREFKIRVDYVDGNGQVIQNIIDSAEVNRDNSKVQILDTNKALVNKFSQLSSNFKIYLKIPGNVSSVKYVKATFVEKNIKTKFTRYNGKYEYYFCSGVGGINEVDNKFHNENCRPTSIVYCMEKNKRDTVNGGPLYAYYKAPNGDGLACQRMKILIEEPGESDEYGNVEKSVEWKDNVELVSELNIIKTDKNTKERLKDAEFKLIKNGTVVRSGVTDKNGELKFENIEFGTYDLYETKAPINYSLSEQTGYIASENRVHVGKITFNSTTPKVQTIELENLKLPSLRINKVDSITNEVLDGAKFDIYDSNNEIVEGSVDANKDIYLPVGTYIIKEKSTPNTEYYDLKYQNKDIKVTLTENNRNKCVNRIATNVQYGDLIIKKVDQVTDNKMEGVGFKVYFEDTNGNKHYIKTLASKVENNEKVTVKNEFTTNVGGATEFFTDTNGEITLENLPVNGYITQNGVKYKNIESGRYYVVETSLPEKYKNYYELGEVKQIKISGKSDRRDDVYRNQLMQLANEATNGWSNEDKTKLVYEYLINKNKISITDYEKKVKVNDTYRYDIEVIIRGTEMSSYDYLKDEFKITEEKEKEKVKVERVKIVVDAIVKEISNKAGKHYSVRGEEYYKDKLTTIVKKHRTNGTVEFRYPNTQLYVDVSGYVWEDKHDDSKKTVRNNLYDQGEKLIENIPVVIKDKTTNTVAKDGDGNELRTLTDKNGTYKFKKVKIEKLKDYYVEFEYNGLKYQNIDKNLSQNNGSKAEEYSKVREEFNNSFASITGGEAKGETTKGYSIDSNGKITNNLTYQSGNKFDSKLVENTGYTVTSANGIVTGNNTSGVSIKADTLSAGYVLNWMPGLYEVKDVNLGLYEREQPDMAVDDDVDHISLEINGYEHSYVYRKREKVKQIDVFANDGIFSGLAKWGTTPEQKQEADYPTSYTRAIYKNDANASGITGNGVLDESKKLRVNIIYKLVIKNESTSLEMSANEIASYYDETLDYVESWYMNGDNKVNVNWDSKDSKDGFKQLRTNSLKDVKIPANKSITVYLKMKKNTILKWAQMDDKYEENTVLYSEITSYSTYYDNKYYAGIDKDSAPDNVDLKNIKETGEDDTASAPDVNIVFKEPRAISGYVFEDDTDAKLKSNDERKGDGKYSADRDGFVGNVNVELLKASNGESVAYIYPKAVSELNLNAEEARYTTSKDGKGFYSFVGVIPDEYILKFTYGDGSVIYKTIDGNATEIKVTTQDYKSTIVTNQSVINAFNNPDNYSTWYRDAKEYSSAVDDYTQRIKINTALKDITNKSKTEYEAKSNADLQKIIAKTPKMKIGIENTESNTTEQNVDNQIDNIDFGIVERPRMSLKVTKEISHIKLTLANGQTLVDGDPRTTQMQYVTYPKDGILKIEVDNEIVEGSTVEIEYDISVENNSELDYNSEQYYKYGIRKNGNQPVGLTISSIVDYLDENLATTYNYNVEGQNIWKRVESKTLNDSKFISNDIYNAIKNKKNIFVNECQIKLQPGQKTNLNTINTLKASKLLTTANELLFTNYVETLKVSNEVGRFYGQEDLNSTSGKNWKTGTPGNFNPYNAEDTHESDDNKGGSTVAIIPPTGLDKNIYVIGSIIGIIILSAIAGVIVYIKKRKIK